MLVKVGKCLDTDTQIFDIFVLFYFLQKQKYMKINVLKHLPTFTKLVKVGKLFTDSVYQSMVFRVAKKFHEGYIDVYG